MPVVDEAGDVVFIEGDVWFEEEEVCGCAWLECSCVLPVECLCVSAGDEVPCFLWGWDVCVWLDG